MLVGQRDLTIGSPSPENPQLYDRVSRVAIVHLAGMEDLPVTTPPGSNGPPA